MENGRGSEHAIMKVTWRKDLWTEVERDVGYKDYTTGLPGVFRQG